ncbi:MAG TPA: chalcone isomerase family protein [Kiritimatiellia bacterium]|nr:chalcone isomerase family protein [Kiritimatiellia bacterium]
MRRILLSSLWLALTAAAIWGADAAVTEASTGKSFPAVRRVATAAGEVEVACAGTGVRTKLVIKVYALGFYVEEAYRQKVRPGWQKQAPTIKRLQETPAFFDSLMRDAYVRQFELQFVREVEADKIRDAFSEGIEDNLPEMKGNATVAADARRFIGWFKNTARENDRLVITIGADGTITAHHNQAELGRLQNPVLAKGVTGIWLGRKCISNSLKEGLITRFYR